MKRFLQLSLLAVFAAAAAFGLWRLRAKNDRLATRVAELRRAAENPELARTREEIRRANALIAQLEADQTGALPAIRADLAAARLEAAQLEANAVRLARELATQTRIENRDPERAFARLEYFRNAGRTTPTAAVQTMVWAALQGDEAALRSTIALDAAARRKAEEWLAHLPPELWTKYPTPESIGALLMSDLLLNSAAAQIKGFTATEENKGFVILNALESGEQPVRIHVARDATAGWQIVVPARAIEDLRRRFEPATRTGPG